MRDENELAKNMAALRNWMEMRIKQRQEQEARDDYDFQRFMSKVLPGSSSREKHGEV